MPLLHKEASISLKRCLGLTALSFGVALGLAEAYALLGRVIAPLWLAAFSLNLLLALALLAAYPVLARSRLLARGPWLAYVPAAVVMFGSCSLAVASQLVSTVEVTRSAAALPREQWAWVLLVPPVEELVFRAGIGQAWRRLAPVGWAAWFSALTFALVHAEPTLGRLASGQVGLALGPFLLGLACEGLLAWTASIVPGMMLHIACNATVIIFSLVDGRWLEWLRLLYQ